MAQRVGIVRAQALVGQPPGLVSATYGEKTAGYARLLALQSGSPHPYSVPPAFAIPPPATGDCRRADLRGAFDALVAGSTGPRVLMARSSGLRESPGANPTHFAAFDPADLEKSWQRFVRIVDRVRGTSPEMGVLTSPMVGENTQLEVDVLRRHTTKSIVAAGLNNLSFVAESHSPLDPNDAYLAVVHGLGTRAVAADNDAIIFMVERETGRVKGVVNSDDNQATKPGGSGTFAREYYRQKEADFFDVSGNGFRKYDLDPNAFEPVANKAYIATGNVFIYADPAGWSTESPDDVEKEYVPFGTRLQPAHLVGILRYLSATIGGAVQVEGAFQNNLATDPALYQLVDAPMPPTKGQPTTITEPHLFSSEVTGKIALEGALIVVRFPSQHHDDLVALDKDLANGYALLTGGHGRQLIVSTPNCRQRLSYGRENLASHASLYTRSQMVRDPAGNYLLAMNVSRSPAFTDLLSAGQNMVKEDIFLFPRVRIESDGRQMRLKVL